jgi:hypothetical protein
MYVYQEVMEACGELVQPTEYTGLGQVPMSFMLPFWQLAYQWPDTKQPF